jgi:hypothetical protein
MRNGCDNDFMKIRKEAGGRVILRIAPAYVCPQGLRKTKKISQVSRTPDPRTEDLSPCCCCFGNDYVDYDDVISY